MAAADNGDNMNKMGRAGEKRCIRAATNAIPFLCLGDTAL